MIAENIERRQTATPSTRSLRVVVSRYAVLSLAFLFTAGALGQFFLVGLSIFDNAVHWADHARLGHWLGIIARLVWIPALLGGVGRRMVVATIVLAVLFEAQYGFVEFDNPTVQALHPMNGALMFGLSTWIVARAFALVRSRESSER